MNEECIMMSLKELKRAEILEQVRCKHLTQLQAGEVLGLERKQVGRLYQAYLQGGTAALVSKRRGQPSNNQLKQSLLDDALKLIRLHYADFAPTLAHEKLTEIHQLNFSVESCRQLMIREGLWTGKRRKTGQVHQSRVRRASFGELVQIDGSPHDWFEGRSETCTLLVFVDDATSKILDLQFEINETTEGYMNAVRRSTSKHGLPLFYYSDKHGIFRVNAVEAKSGTGETQFGRAMRELGVGLIQANSPQAKGRVERMNGVLQDRLVKELRLRGISDRVTANKFLPEFIEDYNRRFAVEPASAVDAHRKVALTENELDLILCQRHTRTITKNLEVHYNNRIYQIQTKSPSLTMRGGTVLVCDQKGKVTLIYKGNQLKYKVFDKGNAPSVIMNSKQLNQHVSMSARHKPAKTHPWRNSPIGKAAIPIAAR